VLNAGSSNTKSCRYRLGADGALVEIARGKTENGEGSIEEVVAQLAASGGEPIAAVGHRVVHGGQSFAEPLLVDRAALAGLRALVPLAPLHLPANLAGIEAALERLRGVPQVACFDTAFHRGRAPVTELLGLPWELHEAGVRRYGFHGLSYQSIAATFARVAPEVARGRVVAAHLGGGASLCALHGGRSVETTMSMTALDGLCMATRPGSVDPGAILHLLQSRGIAVAELESLLYERSGLLGISGVSGDMRELLASDAPRARLAIDFFVHRIAMEIGALTAVLGGIDALVFTGGIGEHAAEIRARVCAASAWLGVALDQAANARGDGQITTDMSRIAAWVIATDEERVIAEHAVRLLQL